MILSTFSYVYGHLCVLIGEVSILVHKKVFLKLILNLYYYFIFSPSLHTLPFGSHQLVLCTNESISVLFFFFLSSPEDLLIDFREWGMEEEREGSRSGMSEGQH